MVSRRREHTESGRIETSWPVQKLFQRYRIGRIVQKDRDRLMQIQFVTCPYSNLISIITRCAQIQSDPE